jgi:membrane-bound metal-dependent hydrolase YbcI (DUF457 family)
MKFMEKPFYPIYKALYLAKGKTLNLHPFILTGISGTILHVMLDAPLYNDILPFYPLTTNPLYDPSLTSTIYNLCLLSGVIGVAYYLIIMIYNIAKKH